jgi:membrane associated rhomboid family serine protease
MIPLRDSQPSNSKPYVTIAIITVNALVFLYQLTLDDYSLYNFVTSFGMVPARLNPVSILSAMFLHGGWLHLIGNMWFLWLYGDNVEDILGHAKYLLFYVLCGVAAALLQLFVSAGSRVPMVGASGAIAGVMGAYLVKFPHSRIVTLVPVVFFLTTMEIPASIILLYWFALQFLNGVGTIGHASVSQGGTAWFAHIGGFVAGLLLILVLQPRMRYRRRQELHW